MKKLLATAALLGIAALAVTGSSCESGALVTTIGFRGDLSGANMVPAVTTSATGTATGTYADELRELGVTITHTIPTTDITGATLNAGIIGENGGTYFDLMPTIVRDTWSVTLRSSDFMPVGSIDTFDKFRNELLNGKTHVIIKTRSNPDGEIRAQLIRL